MGREISRGRESGEGAKRGAVEQVAKPQKIPMSLGYVGKRNRGKRPRPVSGLDSLG